MDEKDYLMALKDVLKRKYSLSGEDAADMILSSYIISLIVLYPEETLHDDIEVHADNIYKVLTKYMLVQRVLSVRSPAKELLSKIITAFRMIISILL